MSYRFVNRPQPIPLQDYGEAVAWLGEKFSQDSDVLAMYRFGNITAPGISDLDLLIVFRDNARCSLTGFEYLPDRYRKVFTHGIMAMKESHFAPNQYYTVWSRNSLVSGTPINPGTRVRDQETESMLHRQTALEFLVANYIDIKVQQAYGVFKVRSLLQHMKGIRYDLEFLGITESPLNAPLQELKEWSLNWFKQTPGDKMLNDWINKWIPEYDAFTEEILKKYPMYLPPMENYRIAKNQELRNAKGLNWMRNGFLLPVQLSAMGKKYFNLQNKFNRFLFGIPVSSEPAHPAIAERFSFLREMKSYNRQYLPGFMTMTTGITAKLIAN